MSSQEAFQGLYSLRRRLTGKVIPIINLRRSDDRLRFIMGIPILIEAMGKLDKFRRQAIRANGFITYKLYNAFEDCIFGYVFKVKSRCGRNFSSDQPDAIAWIMFLNGFTKYQIINTMWYTIIVNNRGKILVKYIGNMHIFPCICNFLCVS